MFDQAGKAVKIIMNIEVAEDRVWSLVRKYGSVMRAGGYVNIIEEKPHIDISHVEKRYKPSQLYQQLLNITTGKERKHLQKENFNPFIRKEAVQTEELQTDQRKTPVKYEKNIKEINQQVRVALHFLKDQKERNLHQT